MRFRFIFILSLLFSMQAKSQVLATKSDDDLVCQSITPGELETYSRLIKRFGSNQVAETTFERNENGLQSYIDKLGIRYFSATEIMTPNNEASAIQCGLTNLIPPQCIWSNGAALLSVFERIREEIAGPIMVRNWWRPSCYNSLVDGAKASDHILAKSFDIDFRNPHDRAVAQKFLCENLWKKGENVQVGIGCNSLHVGLASPRGKRFWVYPSINDCPVKSIDSCWDI
ncbi:MAG: D-Ala-D-Ala carboxypeptidase family metallohydrolase [Bacteriovorax sp.]